jgi:CheY-like chemotaxis protein
MSEPGSQRLVGKDVLVVDDEDLIVAVMEEMLLDLGCGKIWTAGTIEEAEKLLAGHRPHVAVLDVNLGGDSSFRLAQILADQNVPFVFATGYGRHGVPEPWASRPVIPKPFKLETLASVLGALI